MPSQVGQKETKLCMSWKYIILIYFYKVVLCPQNTKYTQTEHKYVLFFFLNECNSFKSWCCLDLYQTKQFDNRCYMHPDIFELI